MYKINIDTHLYIFFLYLSDSSDLQFVMLFMKKICMPISVGKKNIKIIDLYIL